MLSVLYAMACPFVRPSVTQVNQLKTAKGRIVKFSAYGSAILQFFQQMQNF